MADKQKILDLIQEQIQLHKEQIEASEALRLELSNKMHNQDSRNKTTITQVLLFKDKVMHHQTCISCLTDVIEVINNA